MPLSVNTMYTSPRKYSFFQNSLPIVRIFVSFIWILVYNIKYSYDFSQSKFSPWKWHNFSGLFNCKLNEIFWWQQISSFNRLIYPLWAENNTFWKFFFNFLRTILWVNLAILILKFWTYLKSATFNNRYDKSTIFIYYFW